MKSQKKKISVWGKKGEEQGEYGYGGTNGVQILGRDMGSGKSNADTPPFWGINWAWVLGLPAMMIMMIKTYITGHSGLRVKK